MSKLRDTRGFTLIEIMVIVVIISVLMAIAVPSVMKYLGTGDEAKALDEAYACVSAAEYYAVRVFTNGQYIHDIDDKAITKKAGVNGKIVNFTFDENDYTIIGLIYRSTDGITVTFKNDEYIIGKEESWDIENLLAQLQYIDREHSLSDYLTSNSPAKAAQELQRLYKEKNNNEYYPLSQKEKDLMIAQVVNPSYYKGPPVDNLIWKPVYASDGSIILCADDKNTTKSNVVTPMIYYKGNYYVHLFRYKVDAIAQLNSAYVNEYSLQIVNGKPYDSNRPYENEWAVAR